MKSSLTLNEGHGRTLHFTLFNNNSKHKSKTMEKIVYMTPEMEVVELKYQGILCVSGDDAGGATPESGGSVDPSTDPWG